MKYKVGDKVRIKSLDWYKQNKDENGSVLCNYNYYFTRLMTKYCGEVMTVKDIISVPLCRCYMFEEDEFMCHFTDDMIEEFVEEEEIEFTEEDKYWCDIMSESDPTTYVLPQGYQFVDENGNIINTTKIVLEKKEKSYPKSYEECCYVLGFENTELVFEDDYRNINPPKEQWKRLGLMNQFNKLLICRDAYWKLYGEEIGLGKDLSWVPDWMCIDPLYVILYQYHYICKAEVNGGTSCILVFPTEEMRDAFYENFKELIDECKELL